MFTGYLYLYMIHMFLHLLTNIRSKIIENDEKLAVVFINMHNCSWNSDLFIRLTYIYVV